MEARMVCEPAAYLGMLVGAVVVEHEVQLITRIARVDQLQEAQ
jgi:hypothetical protein